MKNGFRQSMAWLHTWTGLVIGWVLFFMFLTGTAGYFDTEIDRWMQPERPLAIATPPLTEAVQTALQRLEQIAPNAERWSINPPRGRDNPDLRIFWRNPPNADGNAGPSGIELLDLETGEPVAYRDTGGGQLLYKMHYRLHYLPLSAAYWIVGIATMFMLVAIVTGVVIHKKIFADFFTFRPRKGQRSWLDAHNVAGVLALPFHVMITYSGLIFFAYLYMAPVIAATYGTGAEDREAFFDELLGGLPEAERSGVAAPLTSIPVLLQRAQDRWGKRQLRNLEIRNPGDARAQVFLRQVRDGPLRSSETLAFDGVNDALLKIVPAVRSTPQAVGAVLLGLHEGLFAGPVLRWLYFLSGALGTAMIGTGLVLWTVKRREKLKAAGKAPVGLLLVERLNVGVVAGLPIAVAAYFWANRLIPVDIDGRAVWEAHGMFVVWVVSLVHPVFRSTLRAWTEQLWLAAGAFGFLPILNAVATGRHLGVTLPQGVWELAGFDLTMLGIGIAFACAACWIGRRYRTASTARPAPGWLSRSRATGPAE